MKLDDCVDCGNGEFKVNGYVNWKNEEIVYWQCSRCGGRNCAGNSVTSGAWKGKITPGIAKGY